MLVVPLNNAKSRLCNILSIGMAGILKVDASVFRFVMPNRWRLWTNTLSYSGPKILLLQDGVNIDRVVRLREGVVETKALLVTETEQM